MRLSSPLVAWRSHRGLGVSFFKLGYGVEVGQCRSGDGPIDPVRACPHQQCDDAWR
jgi:hypothetical protein